MSQGFTTPLAIPVPVSQGGTGVTTSTGTGSVVLSDNPTLIGVTKYELISSATASSSASIVFTGLSSTYSSYIVLFSNVVPVNDNVHFEFLLSTDGGSSYLSSYSWGGSVGVDTGILASSHGAVQPSQYVFPGQGNAAGEDMSGEIKLLSLADGTRRAKYLTNAVGRIASGELQYRSHGGSTNTATVINTIRLQYSSGNISVGNFYLYGIKAS